MTATATEQTTETTTTAPTTTTKPARQSRASRGAAKATASKPAAVKSKPAAAKVTKSTKKATVKKDTGPSEREQHQKAQQLCADILAGVTDAQLRRVGITRDQFIAGARQVLGYSSHQVTIPAMFGARYDGHGTALWGRPAPAKKS